jgi:hypothetical protein
MATNVKMMTQIKINVTSICDADDNEMMLMMMTLMLKKVGKNAKYFKVIF